MPTNGASSNRGELLLEGLRRTVRPVAIFIMLFTVYYAFTLSLPRTIFVNIVLGLGLYVYFIQEFFNEGSWGETQESESSTSLGRLNRIACLPSALISLLATGYVHLHFERLQSSAPIVGYTELDIIMGFLIMFLVTDATRRAFGNAIPIVVILTILYAIYGQQFPGIFKHSGLALKDVSRFGAISLTGVYGAILTVGTTWVAIFIMLAGLLKEYELMDYVISIADEMRGTLRSGVILLAVFASMVMGSLTGSAAANTATTGSFTIPMMKKQGVRDDFAGAVESIASTGGQIMPPVMGTAAFLMADILSVRYLEVVAAGLIPATLFYFTVAITVYFFAFRHGWVNTDTKTSFRFSVLLEGLHFVIPFVVLLYCLIELGLTPLGAGKYTIVSAILTAFGKAVFEDLWNVDSLVEVTKQTIDGFETGTTDFVPLIGILGAIGIIIRMVQLSGLSQKLSIQIVAIAGGLFLAVLALTMVVSLMLGLGMPTPAAYLLVAILVAPSIVEFGIEPLSAHMFVFYFAMLSAITPPVAVAAAIGAQIAGASFLKTVWQTARMSFIVYMIPFMFIYNPELIQLTFPQSLVTFLMIIVSIVAMSICVVGHNGFRKLSTPYRLAYFGLGISIPFGPIVSSNSMIPIVATLGVLIVAIVSIRWTLYRSAIAYREGLQN